MDYQPSYGFLKDCLYRSESYKVTLADAYGQLTQTYGDALDSVSTFVKEKPVAALAIGAVALLILDRLLRR